MQFLSTAISRRWLITLPLNTNPEEDRLGQWLRYVDGDRVHNVTLYHVYHESHAVRYCTYTYTMKLQRSLSTSTTLTILIGVRGVLAGGEVSYLDQRPRYVTLNRGHLCAALNPAELFLDRVELLDFGDGIARVRGPAAENQERALPGQDVRGQQGMIALFEN